MKISQSNYNFLKNILRKIEQMKEGVVAWAYFTGNAPMTNTWWEVAVSDYDLYREDKQLKSYMDAWHKVGRKRGMKIIFVCGWMPKEKKLSELAEKDNLILNIY